MCTAIKIDYKYGTIMGRTMDYEIALKYNVIYLPSRYRFCDDLMGKEIYSKHKAMGVCFENKDSLKDGINEHGLIGVTNAFSGFNLYSNKVEENKTNISSLSYLSYALSNYKSVDEIIKDLDNIHISTKNSSGENIICPDFHYMFTDSTKRSIVIEPNKGKLNFYENPYGIMTNSPKFTSHIKKLKETFDLDNLGEFNSAKNLPGGYDPSSRFIKAYYLCKTIHKAEEYSDALSNFYSIMGTMSLPEGFILNKKYNYSTYTRYICGYDTFHKKLTIKSHRNPTVYSLGFEDIQNKNQRQEFFIEDKFLLQDLK